MFEVRTEVDVVRDMDEAELAFNLSLSAFYPDGFSAETESLWRYKWFFDPSFELKNVFIIKGRNGRLLGGLRAVKRLIRRSGQVFSVLGIAETFVDPCEQGKGYSSTLTSYAIQEGKRRGHDIIVVVARKLIDYFYLKYRGYGIGAYNEVVLRGFGDRFEKNCKLSTCECSGDDILIMNEAYEYSYSNCFGPMIRDIDHWKFLLGSNNSRNEKIRLIKDNNDIVGYLFFRKGSVEEIALLPTVEYRPVVDYLNEHFSEKKTGALRLRIPGNHRLLDADLQLDVTLKSRECYYGGHIVKILNMKTIKTFMEERVRKSLLQKKVMPLNFALENVKVKWDGEDVKVSYCSDLEPSYQETLFLLGSNSVYGKREGLNTFESLPFVLCGKDEF